MELVMNILALIYKAAIVAGLTAAFILITGLLLTLMNILPSNNHTIAYDCRLAEISVDYPQQVKEQCRKLLK
jgi:hypothetical protein